MHFLSFYGDYVCVPKDDLQNIGYQIRTILLYLSSLCNLATDGVYIVWNTPFPLSLIGLNGKDKLLKCCFCSSALFSTYIQSEFIRQKIYKLHHVHTCSTNMNMGQRMTKPTIKLMRAVGLHYGPCKHAVSQHNVKVV